MWQQSGSLLFCRCHGIAGFLVDELQIWVWRHFLEVLPDMTLIFIFKKEYIIFRGCASRSPEASETQLGRVKAICDLARLASGIIVIISVFNSLLNNVFCLCTALCSRMCTALHAYVV